VIVGGGPAGLTAAARLARGGRRTLLLEQELFGGNLKHVGRVDGVPGVPDGVPGAQLASELAEEAQRSGARLLEARAAGIEAFSSTRWVACEDGGGWSTSVVVVASGTRLKRLGVPGEDLLVGRGVIDCVPCDGALFRNRSVLVYGDDGHALGEAALLRSLGVRVTELAPGRAALTRVLGGERVEGVAWTDRASGREESLPVEGVVIRVGSEPNTGFLADLVDLDPGGHVVTGPELETGVPGLLAAGDVRRGAPGRVAAAIEDGAAAARRVAALLDRLAADGA
jgi:thioredoxin reductase (NADPH)